MEDNLQEELSEKYKGKKVKEDRIYDLEDEELLTASSSIDDDELEITVCMGIQIETDENDCIDEVYVYFRTYCHGDSGLGDEDPEDYWEYGECLAAAEEYIKNTLE